MVTLLKTVLLVCGCLLLANPVFCQSAQDSIRLEILGLQADVERIHLNLETSKSKFQRGILVATLGYSITIAGGLMLGRKNDNVGQALLVAGGVTGGIGTYLLVDSFKYLGRTRKKSP
ncbi:MAG: hypothetical protein R2804_01720 [Cyclobacteriaceae bacterium]|jgi:hypothetical protein